MWPDRRNEPVVASLTEELRDCESVLDLGCGPSSLLQYVSEIRYSMGVDIWEPYIEESRSCRIHNDYSLSGILDYDAGIQTYDAVICIDVLEHIEKKAAEDLIQRMKKTAKKKVILYVPNGFIHQDDLYDEGNRFQEHVSDWTPHDLEKWGFCVTGFSGWKYLRGEGGDIRIKSPGIIRSGFHLISRLTESFCKTHPNYAFHLFAVYTAPAVPVSEQ
jgi:SAM-dependent methyltransferase